MKIWEAREHSPAQLQLLRSAAKRLSAQTVLAQLNANYAAFAAVMASNGRNVFAKLQKDLVKASEQ